MPTPSRTINRLHFDDLSPSRFEDLSLALVYRHKHWEDIHHDGRLGSDDGVDIRGVTTGDDGAIQIWVVQCKRYTKFTAADGRAAVREAVKKASVIPDVILLIVGCDVTVASRSGFEMAAIEAGIKCAVLWTAAKLETMLYTDHPDLLFGYFGVSIAQKIRSREMSLQRSLVLKRKMRKIFPPVQHTQGILIRSIDDVDYPNSIESKGISPWFRVAFFDHYHNGIKVSLQIIAIIHDVKTGKWASINYAERGDISKSDEEYFENSTYEVVKVRVVGKIPFRSIIEVDEEGDEYYDVPHIYCRFENSGEPYEEVFMSEVNGHREFLKEQRFPFKDRTLESTPIERKR